MSTRVRGLVVAVVALALFGCAPSTPSEKPSEDASAEKPSPSVSSVEEPAPDGTALDAYVAQEQANIPAIMEMTPGMYSAIAIEAAPPSTIVFRYVYAEQVDPVASAEYFDGMVPTLQTLCDTQVFPALQKAGVTDPSAVYTYVNADGSEVWTHTFMPS